MQISKAPRDEYLMDRSFFWEAAQCIVDDELQRSFGFVYDYAMKKSISKHEQGLLLRAKKIIDSSFTSVIRVPDVAAEVGMSEYKFHRSFKLFYGDSPYNYLLKKRLYFSLYLLHYKGMSTTETAYLTGFSDIHAFSKAYKRWFKPSPINHRRTL